MSDPSNPGARVGVDLNLPLWGIISAVGGGFILLVGLFYNVSSLTASMKDLQITVQAGNTAYSVLSGEMALQKFRLGTVEADLGQIKELIRQQGMRK